jgi:hypothetical protein
MAVITMESVSIKGAAVIEAYHTDRDIQQDIVDYLPRYYNAFQQIMGAALTEGNESIRMFAKLRELLDQFYVISATWGLSRWEQFLGITVDENKPIDQRRSVVISKLRGIGVANVALIQNVAESYFGGEVEVGEDNANYTVVVTFVGEHGIPQNLSDIENAIREIVPAHLAINYVFTYMTFGDLTGYGLTFGDITTKNLTFYDFGRYKQ